MNASWFREWRPLIIVGGLLVVIMVNILLFYLSNQDFPGVVENDYYKKGVYYNEYLARLEHQRARGWQLNLGWVAEPKTGQPATLRCVAKDKAGQPITGATVEVKLLRPGEPAVDQSLRLQEVAPGDYQNTVSLPRPGNWDLLLTMSKGQDQHEKQAEVWVIPAAGAGG